MKFNVYFWMVAVAIIGCSACTECKDAACCYWCSVVCVHVCLLDITMICAETAEAIEMPFWLWTQVGPRNHVLGGGPDHCRGRGNFFFGGGDPCYVAFRLTTCYVLALQLKYTCAVLILPVFQICSYLESELVIMLNSITALSLCSDSLILWSCSRLDDFLKHKCLRDHSQSILHPSEVPLPMARTPV